MGYMSEFPHTRMFDSDLREILDMYLKLNYLPSSWEDFKTMMGNDWSDLKNFVNNYFTDLDVQTEINNKIDAMIASGDFVRVLAPYFNELKVLEARMNTFTRLEEGSTTGDAELGDGRVDFKGTTHTNIGEHIRQATSQLSSDIGDVKSKLKDTLADLGADFVTTTFTENRFVAFDSTIDESDNYCFSAPIYAEKGNLIKVKAKGYETRVKIISLTDENGTPISGGVISDGNEYHYYEYTMPENGYFCVSGDMIDPIVITIFDNISKDNFNDFCMETSEKFEIIGLEEVETEYINGYYIYSNDSIEANSDFKYSAPIYAKRNTEIIVKASGYSTAVKVISLTDENGSSVYGGVSSVDSVYKTYRYIMPKDGYFRVCGGIINPIIIKTVKHSENEKNNLFNIFRKIGVIGDSLSSGCVCKSSSEAKDIYDFSWLSLMARKNGFTPVHYSKGGLTCETWLSSEYYNQLATDEKCDAYYIALGTNDAWFKPYEVGTIDDVAGTNTFVGKYKQIIEYVKLQAPNSPIFCISSYDSTNNDYIAMVKEIVGVYDNCYYIDLVHYGRLHGDKAGWTYWRYSHYTTVGYPIVAEDIKRITNDVMNENVSDFSLFSYNI